MNNIAKTFAKVVMLLVSIIIFVVSICSLDADKISVCHCLLQCATGEAMLLIATHYM